MSRRVLAGLAVALACAIGVADPGRAQDASEADEDPVDLDESLYDPENALDIMEICAGCHGEYGEGGGDGTYPRLAGLPARYLADELRAFKARERENIPMYPFATERELPEADVRDISLYLSGIELLSQMPALPDSVEAYERLQIAKRVFNVPRREGDVPNGEAVYRQYCRLCHGKAGEGRTRTPPLAGQYTDYLRLQVEKFLKGERFHKNVPKYLEPLSEQDWNDLYAYLAQLDD
ncbi:MAG: hypothetical protein DHS20C21_07880 [Gemmatimonadota bacterium]|nr:MAG: hypothetical protein DHS20C21_07880 [Gemmatimonadota bacterium]